ncbi:MAG TPA: hypothetical protein VF054_04670 [Micromonosporaceae bacterium]
MGVTQEQATGLSAERYVWPDSRERLFVAATSRALRGADCHDLAGAPVLARTGVLPAPLSRLVVGRAAARATVPARHLCELDPESVAEWIVGHYRRDDYPAVVIGSPHGGAVHLAVALGAPWLPAAFEVVAEWPDAGANNCAGALAHGIATAQPLLDRHTPVTLRQIHDPVSRPAQTSAGITVQVRWQQAPYPYLEFLSTRLAPDAPLLVVRDTTTWPVINVGDRYSFQLGGPESGMSPSGFYREQPALWRVAERRGRTRHGPTHVTAYCERGVEPGLVENLQACVPRPMRRIIYNRPEVFSGGVADLYRSWLRRAGKSGNRLVVESGRLLDPWQVVRAGLVPYWCPNPLRETASAVEWWLAGGQPFTSIDVLLDPPGSGWAELAPLEQWRSAATFATRRGMLDPAGVRSYPTGWLPTRHATAMLRQAPYDLPAPQPLDVTTALEHLGATSPAAGMLVC